MNLSFDIKKTKAILIGVSQFGSGFDAIPPIDSNLLRLRELFINPDVIGLEPNNVLIIHNKNNITILKELKNALNQPNFSTLIVYYAGHGFRKNRDKLYLTAINSESDLDLIAISGIDFIDFKSLIEKSPAQNRFLFLDACYSGIATQGADSFNSLDQEIQGTYTIASSPRDEQSLFDPNGEFTFFTGELIRLLSLGEESNSNIFTIGEIYDKLKHQLIRQGYPEPQRKDNLNSGKFYFAKNFRYNEQELLNKANTYFANNDYKEALDIYKKINLWFSNEDVSYYIQKCRNLLDSFALLKEANDLFYNKNDYETAKIIYQKVFLLNHDDSFAKMQIDECSKYIEIIKKTNEEILRKEQIARQQELRKKREEIVRQEELRKEQEEKVRQEKLRKEQEEKVRQEKLRKEQEEKARQEKLRKEQEEKARQEKLRKEQEEKARQEKLRKEQEEKARQEKEQEEKNNQDRQEQYKKEQRLKQQESRIKKAKDSERERLLKEEAERVKQYENYSQNNEIVNEKNSKEDILEIEHWYDLGLRIIVTFVSGSVLFFIGLIVGIYNSGFPEHWVFGLLGFIMTFIVFLVIFSIIQSIIDFLVRFLNRFYNVKKWHYKLYIVILYLLFFHFYRVMFNNNQNMFALIDGLGLLYGVIYVGIYSTIDYLTTLDSTNETI